MPVKIVQVYKVYESTVIVNQKIKKYTGKEVVVDRSRIGAGAGKLKTPKKKKMKKRGKTSFKS